VQKRADQAEREERGSGAGEVGFEVGLRTEQRLQDHEVASLLQACSQVTAGVIYGTAGYLTSTSSWLTVVMMVLTRGREAAAVSWLLDAAWPARRAFSSASALASS
jgi:hypothetical protein